LDLAGWQYVDRENVLRRCRRNVGGAVRHGGTCPEPRAVFGPPRLEVTTAFESSFRPDAESTTVMTGVDPDGVDLS
jgi:hypothetical protein